MKNKFKLVFFFITNQKKKITFSSVKSRLIRNQNFTTFVIMKSNKFYSQVNQIVDISSAAPFFFLFDVIHMNIILINKQKKG